MADPAETPAATCQGPLRWYKAVKRTRNPAVFRSRCGKGLSTLWRMGQTNVLDNALDEPILCVRGFHACHNPVAPFLDFLCYGYSHKTDALLEVTLGGKVVSDGIKTAATSCTPVRVVPAEELAELMQTPTVLENAKTGDTYHVKDGVLHRDGDGPAVVMADGTWKWYKLGVLCRDGDKPAVIWADETQEWYKNGVLHRDGDAPAVISERSFKGWYWYKDGKLHRDDDKPAVIMANSRQEWYKNGKLHRDDDKPAIIMATGTQLWYKHDTLHRDGDNPAVVWP